MTVGFEWVPEGRGVKLGQQDDPGASPGERRRWQNAGGCQRGGQCSGLLSRPLHVSPRSAGEYSLAVPSGLTYDGDDLPLAERPSGGIRHSPAASLSYQEVSTLVGRGSVCRIVHAGSSLGREGDLPLEGWLLARAVALQD